MWGRSYDEADLIAITNRAEVRDRLSRIAPAVGLSKPVFLSCATELEACYETPRVLFVDLASCTTDVAIESCIGAWSRANPQSELVFFVPLLDRERETRLLFRLGAMGTGRVMTASDFARIEVWRNVQQTFQHTMLAAEISGEFRNAVVRTGQRLRAEPIVLQLLTDAPRVRDVNQSVISALRQYQARAEAGRKAVWAQLRRAKQMPVSWLLLTLRILWYAKLREKGWSTTEIAHFMSFEDPRELRRALRRRAGISIRDLKRVRYHTALDWAAGMVTGGYAEAGFAHVSEMMKPLMRAVTRPE